MLDKDAEIAALRDTNATHQDEIAALVERVAALEAGGGSGQLLMGLLAGAVIGAGALALGMKWRGFALGRRVAHP